MPKPIVTRYFCDKCDFKAIRKHLLAEHIKSMHEGIKLQCEVMGCKYEANTSKSIFCHIKSKHEGVTYPCM